MCRVGNQEGEILSGGDRLAVEKRVEGWESRSENRGSSGRWSMADGPGPRQGDRDGGMGGLKFAGGNLGGDQGPAPCACDRAAGSRL